MSPFFDSLAMPMQDGLLFVIGLVAVQSVVTMEMAKFSVKQTDVE